MSKIHLMEFNGIMPRIAPKLLPDNCAQTAVNCKLLSKRVEPYKAPLIIAGTGSHFNKETIFLWHRNSTTEWLSWTGDVDVVRGPIADDDYDRIYYTGDGLPKVKGWASGAAVTRNMAMPIASKPTANDRHPYDAYITAGLQCHLYGYLNNGSAEYAGAGFPIAGGLLSFTRSGTDIILKYRFQYTPDWAYGNTMYTYLQLVYGGSSIPNPKSKTVLQAAGTITIEGQEFTVSNIKETVLQHDVSATPAFPDIREEEITLTTNYGGDSEDKDCYYVQTWVDDWGIEGPESDISDSVTIKPGDVVTLSNLGTTTGNTTLRRFYRSVSGTNEDAFFYVGECAAAATTFTDDKSDAELEEEIELFENPPDDLAGIVMMPGGFAAAFRTTSLKEILFTPPFLPHSWPTEYRLTVDYDIVGLAVSGNDLIVLTTGNPYLITGTHPDNMSVTQLMLNQSCVSKRGICQIGNFVCYPSPDGLVMVSGGQANLVTEKYYKKEEWAAILPATMRADVYDKRMIVFTDYPLHSTTGAYGLIFDFDEGLAAVTTIDLTIYTGYATWPTSGWAGGTYAVKGLYSDLEDDTLYLAMSDGIYSWDKATSPLQLDWRSKEFAGNREVNWNSARIVADTYPMQLKIYAENVLIQTITVSNQTSFRLPRMRPERVWSVEVIGFYGVDYLAIGTSMAELV